MTVDEFNSLDAQDLRRLRAEVTKVKQLAIHDGIILDDNDFEVFEGCLHIDDMCATDWLDSMLAD